MVEVKIVPGVVFIKVVVRAEVADEAEELPKEL